jgi:outer membrane protein TolC
MCIRPRLCALFLLPIALATLAQSTFGASAHAESASRDPLELAVAERQALARDHSLARLDAEADALGERAIADSQLPDPELTVGYQDLPVRNFSTTDEMMTMLMVGVRQHVPPGRTRALRRDQGEIASATRRAERDERALEVQREVRRSWLDWRFAHDAASLARDAETEFSDLIALTERRVAAGTARSRDLFQARLEHAALHERIIELDSERDAAGADLERWLGEPIAGRLPGGAPDWQAPDGAILREGLTAHPALAALDRQRAASRVATDIARQAYRPSWMFELGYGYRGGRDMATGERRSDMLTGMVSFNLPLFTGQRQDRHLAAAQHELNAAESGYADLLRRLAGELERSLVLWGRLDELVRFYRAELLPEADQTVLTTASAYRSDLATFDELIRARVAELDFQLRALRLERNRDQARIELLYLAGE